MNPILLKLGITAIVAVVGVVVCVATAYGVSRRQQSLLEHRISRFDGTNITMCCVCLEEFKVVNENALVTLPCKHKFHTKCIKQVFTNEFKACPTCRSRVDSGVIARVLQKSE